MTGECLHLVTGSTARYPRMTSRTGVIAWGSRQNSLRVVAEFA